jgi:hypothetical protein
MTDTFSRVCAIIALVILAAIAFNVNKSRGDSEVASRYPFARNPTYLVFETEPDAKQISQILSKYANEGAFTLAAAPIVKSGAGEKVILILVQHW